MISVAALRMQQFGVQFYQASLTAKDIDKLVRFEVLNYGEQGTAPGVARQRAPVEGPLGSARTPHRLEREGVSAPDHPQEDRRARRSTTSSAVRRATCRRFAGAVIISCDEPLKFEPIARDPSLGILKVPEREGILRAIDGQHRLLALHAGMEQFGGENFTVPAVIFDRLPEDHVVQMFVTINAKHTRLNASHLVSLSGRQLYRDENLAAAHDVVRALSEREDSPLHGEIKLLGVGHGRVAQAPLAQELKKLFATDAFGPGKKGDEFREDAKQLLRELLPAGGGGVRRRVERPQVQHQVGAGAARVHPRRAGHRPAASTSSTPTAPTSARSAASSRRGAAASATCASRPTAPGSAPARRSTSSRRSCGSRCSIPKARWFDSGRIVVSLVSPKVRLCPQE